MKTTEARDILVGHTFVRTDSESCLWLRLDGAAVNTGYIRARRLAVLRDGVWVFEQKALDEEFYGREEVDAIQFTALDGADERLLEVRCVTRVLETIKRDDCRNKRQLCADLFENVDGTDTDNVGRLVDKAVTELLRRGLITRDHSDDGEIWFEPA